MTTRYGSATVTLPDDTTILITRSFEAPIDLVWEAITTPQHLLRWWGPSWCPLVACEVDLRPGGAAPTGSARSTPPRGTARHRARAGSLATWFATWSSGCRRC